MKLKVGMYVRTEWGINKIKDIVLNGGLYEDSGLIFENGKLCCGKEAMKELRASNYIIDLIEVGDYVNGSKVVNIDYDLDFDEDIVESITILDHSLEERDVLYNNNIKSIITKEQFESMQYKVGE